MSTYGSHLFLVTFFFHVKGMCIEFSVEALMINYKGGVIKTKNSYETIFYDWNCERCVMIFHLYTQITSLLWVAKQGI